MSTTSSSISQIEQTQKQVNEVIDILTGVVNDMIKRGVQLEDLDQTSQRILIGARRFEVIRVL